MNKIKVMCLVDCILVMVGLFLVGINPFGRPAIGIIFIIISWIMVIITCFVWKSSFKRMTNKSMNTSASMGMCFGVAIGSALGVIFDGITSYVAIGMSIGLAVATIIVSKKDQTVKEQVEENHGE